MQLFVFDPDIGNWAASELNPCEARQLGGQAEVLVLAGQRCVLLSRETCLVNGLPSPPLKVLSHRDEISAGGCRAILSLESPARVTPFCPAPGGKVTRCGVCLGEMLRGQPALGCPRCRAVYHPDCWLRRGNAAAADAT